MNTKRTDIHTRLLRHIDRTGECWLWTASTSLSGYGRILISPDPPRRLAQAHRVMYELVHGPIPAGLVVRHTCDNPQCCRPDHLLIGTQADNVRDMHERNRAGYTGTAGVAHPNAKLTDADVSTIRAMRADGALLKDLAAQFGIGTSSVWRICTGQSWSHIPAANRAALFKVARPELVTT